jgi:hypothetical protein
MTAYNEMQYHAEYIDPNHPGRGRELFRFPRKQLRDRFIQANKGAHAISPAAYRKHAKRDERP